MIEKVAPKHAARVPDKSPWNTGSSFGDHEFDRELRRQQHSILDRWKFNLTAAAGNIQQLHGMLAIGQNNLAIAATGDAIVYSALRGFGPRRWLRRIFHSIFRRVVFPYEDATMTPIPMDGQPNSEFFSPTLWYQANT
jgi:hypothetical protein